VAEIKKSRLCGRDKEIQRKSKGSITFTGQEKLSYIEVFIYPIGWIEICMLWGCPL
jgi:hypothetical protein